MPEFPTIVRQRLRAGEDRKGLHPDADTLTAYVEQLLPSHERDYVIRHLSVCAECRDVLTLTMPEIAAEAALPEVVAIPAASIVPAAPPAPRRSWFFTPAFWHGSLGCGHGTGAGPGPQTGSRPRFGSFSPAEAAAAGSGEKRRQSRRTRSDYGQGC